MVKSFFVFVLTNTVEKKGNLHNVRILKCPDLGFSSISLLGTKKLTISVRRVPHIAANTILVSMVVSSRTTLELGMVQPEHYVG